MLALLGQPTIRLGRYKWNTSKEGSSQQKKREKKVEEIQLANLASLGSLTSKNGLDNDILEISDPK